MTHLNSRKVNVKQTLTLGRLKTYCSISCFHFSANNMSRFVRFGGEESTKTNFSYIEKILQFIANQLSGLLRTFLVK